VIVQVRYRIDAHNYDRNRGCCPDSCRSCRLERTAWPNPAAAIAAQPAAEALREDGEQGALAPPARRFEVVVVDFVGDPPAAGPGVAAGRGIKGL